LATRTNWNSVGAISNVVGQLAWKNYGNNHTIFDASASTSPDGTSVNNTNPSVNWSGTYPTLMGWNGASTYGVRVDVCRFADYAYYLNGPAYTNGSDGWFRTTGQAGMYYASYGRGIWPADGTISYGNNTIYGSGLNGWTGWGVNNSNTCILMSNASTHGFYNPANGLWQAQWDNSGNVTWNGNVTAYSDLRFKENVREIDNVIERRDTLAKAAIKYERDGRTRIGYGAQTLRDNGCAEFVLEADDSLKTATGLGTLSVDYGETTSVLAVVSKMTDDRMAALEARIAQLEALLAAKD